MKVIKVPQVYNAKINNPNWHGGRTVVNGYLHVLHGTHHRANHNGYVREHILLAEKALGKHMPKEAVVHHGDADKSRNRGNLVICQDNSYHKLLHRRMNALRSCGHAGWVKYRECKQWGDPSSMKIHTKKKFRNVYIHRECNNIRMNQYYHRKISKRG